MTDSLETLAKKLLDGKKVTLSYQRFNDGTEENPDILINRVYAIIEKDQDGNKDVCVYISKEDDEVVGDVYQIYKMPFITDLNVLKYMLKEAKKQSHL